MNDPRDLTGELSRQLHAQVDRWHSAPLTVGEVRDRARALRRRRTAVTTGVAATGVLVAVGPAGVAGHGPAPRVTVEPPTYDGPVLGVPYVEGPRVVLPDGSVREVAPGYVGGAVLGDTLLGLRNDDAGFLALDELDEAGRVMNTVVTESGITFNAEESAIAYVTDGELIVRWDDGVADLGEVSGATPVRLVGGPDCTTGVATCAVYVNDERGGARVITNTGADPSVAGDPRSVTDVAVDGRVSMVTDHTEVPEPGSCSSVVASGSATEIHGSCDYTFGTFSPDGALLSASHPYLDGFGLGWLAILDAGTGAELTRYESGTGGITSSVWEDDDHVLITSWEEGRWQVTRLASDGATEVVLGPTPGSDVDPTFAVLGQGF